MKRLFGMVLALMVLLGSGCSTTATYQVPDYYETKLVPYHYQPGDVRSIDELKASMRLKDKTAQELSQGWITHRTYKKQTIFE
ncbi:hypothetical protein [Hydrogenovibrio marinus]|uniref:Lipoprotein n=1 Tax=Hydrogenovibrio marinus TaxID=28885 RepID=A0A066ZPS3_HYDMR|nr:hypothetical protein [Hydrogenovibrio marinus]KDN95517.1 hypothetical protein EI16_04235 [Hydrogenovibrio marinus]BBN60009.1 hypothetical protein HVMH_1603 [Hydrogenovibrio marinus]